MPLPRLRVSSSKLLQHAQIVFKKRTNVRDVELDHRRAIEAETERRSTPLVGIDSDIAQHLRMNHAAAENLTPAGERTGVAPLASAEDAGHVDFRRRPGDG